MSNTLFFDLTFNFKKKERVNIKSRCSFASSDNGQIILGEESKIEICPTCSYNINTIETPDRCPNCERISLIFSPKFVISNRGLLFPKIRSEATIFEDPLLL